MSLHTLPRSLCPPRVLVIGAGVGGLSAAALLAREGLDVQLLERAATPGGKMRQVEFGPLRLDGGPTVLTMRWVFDALFERLGLSLDRHLHLSRCEVLARHAWGPDERLDLSADLEGSVAAMAAFSNAAEARRYRAFCSRARQVHDTLDRPFMRSTRPTPGSLAWRVLRQQGLPGLRQLLRISPFTTLWRELGRYFHDPRLRQLFGRYATYCGSSPFDAPATLMLVAHVEREAVWQVEGGMHRLAQALAGCAQALGVRSRYGCEARRLLLAHGRVSGVELADGERLPADIVVFNGDAQALSQGLLDEPVRQALGAPAQSQPSLSALTWHGEAEAGGFELSHHNVFFGPPGGYRAEFEAIAAGRLPDSPTVYVCAQDRNADARPARGGPRRPERLMCLVNAPAQTGQRPLTELEIARCEAQMWTQLSRAGLRLRPTGPPVLTRPQDFAQLFPGSGGALYGPAAQGWRASFHARPDGRTPVPGLYLAGGSVHPGPGVPMAALSGQLAAEQILAALPSTSRSRPALMPGGMSTR
ncbi:MAG: phytoene desaturase [Burkholderiales bacterium]|nr:phytoene desaturase [Burkholderiales bacterium]